MIVCYIRESVEAKKLSHLWHAMPSKRLYLNSQLMMRVVLLYLQQLGSLDLAFV